jgi:hypothetical protein
MDDTQRSALSRRARRVVRTTPRRGAQGGRCWFTIVCSLAVTGISTALPAQSPSAPPPGALAFYEFAGFTPPAIPNLVQGPGALPPLTISGSSFRVDNGETVWNENSNFTFSFPFDASRGTFAETAASFPNVYGSGGTLGVRLRLNPSVVTNLGQASSMGLITFRPYPDVNIHRVTPRGLELHRDGPTDPLHFLVREGNNSIGYNNEFNDEVRSAPLVNPAADKTAIVVWTPQTLRIYVDGVLSGTASRVTVDHPTAAYRLMVAVQPSLIHGGDNQFYKGAIRTLTIVDRPLGATEVDDLHRLLSGEGGPAAPRAPANLRIVS